MLRGVWTFGESCLEPVEAQVGRGVRIHIQELVGACADAAMRRCACGTPRFENESASHDGQLPRSAVHTGTTLNAESAVAPSCGPLLYSLARV